MRYGIVSNKFMVSQMRLDGNFHLSEGLNVRKQIRKSPYKILTIDDFTKDVYCPGIFKRNYVNKGTPFLGGGDIQKSYSNCGKYLLEKTTPNYSSLLVEKGCTLVTCGGTIGDAVFANGILSRCLASQHVLRVIPDGIKEGMLFAYLASSYGKLLLTTNTYGSVIPTLNSNYVKKVPIPDFPEDFQQNIDSLVKKAAEQREEASDLLQEAQMLLKQYANLPEISYDDYDFNGAPIQSRSASTFIRSRKDVTSMSFHAINYSERIRQLENKIKVSTQPLSEVIEDGKFFNTGSFPRVEVAKEHGIMLINQSDIFDRIIKGKYISKRGVKTDNLVEYGEVMIAGVGTLGEGETFCRAIFANEDLEGQLVSGEFIRMKTNGTVPAGYLYAWLSSDYGFRLIRSTHTGTKLCRPIQKLLLQKPVPIIDQKYMDEIDEKVRKAHTLWYEANINEKQAIQMVEKEIEKWNN